MIVSKSELFAILRQFNPWWDERKIPDLPLWRRAAFKPLMGWLTDPPAPRAILLSGARQVGKTTLLLQAIEELLDQGVSPDRILYITFDHPITKLIGLEQVLKSWKEIQPPSEGIEYLLLDEIQYTENWPTWLKHQADFQKKRRIAVTGSATPLNTKDQESGVGRWHTIKLPTLSFYEYLQIKNIAIPRLPKIKTLKEIFSWSPEKRIQLSETARPLEPYFNEYLLRGGFPQTAQVENISTAQRLLREDIVDKVLKRDMTALYGVRRVLEMEKTFLYLCLHDGGILDLPTLCRNLELNKQTVSNFIELFESAHLIYKLPPYGYGKEVLRGKYKVYLADAAIAGSVLLKGRSLIEDNTRLGAAVETAFFKHVYSRYYPISIRFSYWKSKKNYEVDIVAEVHNDIIPFEVKYTQSHIKMQDIKGLVQLCKEKNLPRGYIITREFSDFDVIPEKITQTNTTFLKIPAPLACFWLSQSEIEEPLLEGDALK